MLADQSQPLLLRRLDARLHFLGGARQALAVDAKEGPVALPRLGTITEPLVLITLSPVHTPAIPDTIWPPPWVHA